MTVSTMQLGVCSLYAFTLWLISWNPIKLTGLQKPDRMFLPKVTFDDIVKTIPVGFCSAAAHSAGVFCLGADPLFGQIVKAGEPVLAALVNTVFYGKPPSFMKFVCLWFIVGGVAFASLKKGPDGGYALKFDETALLFGMIGNTFAAFKGSENKKLMEDKELKSRMGGVANQFALTECLAFAISLPVMYATEGDKVRRPNAGGDRDEGEGSEARFARTHLPLTQPLNLSRPPPLSLWRSGPRSTTSC